MQKVIKKTYKNGLRVITVPMKDNPTVTVLVLVGTGSNYETKNINGISHFLEHMCFKGTEKRPDYKIITHELDALGCHYNAFTDREMTGYYIKGDSKKFKKIFEIISDIYLNSTFPEKEIEKEKGVIIEEINMYEDLPQSHVQDLFQEVLYGDQPAGWNVAGTKENIKKLTRDNFVEYKKNHYTANNTIVVVSGNISQKEVITETNKYFNKITKQKSIKKTKTKDLQQKPNILLKYKETDQTHLVLGFRTFSIFDKRNPVLLILAGILGAGMSSRLFIKLREEMGVAYYVYANNNKYLDYGSLQISAGVNNLRAREVICEILKELKKIKNENVSEKELNKVKSFLIGNLKMSLESTDNVANFYGNQEVTKGEIQTLENKIKEIKNVKAKDVKKLAQEIFIKKHLNLAIVGPSKKEQEFIEILDL